MAQSAGGDDSCSMPKLPQRFGRAVRKLREKTDLSQERFAFKAGIDRRYYAKIEHGEANVTLNVLDKVANALDISLVELFRAIEKE